MLHPKMVKMDEYLGAYSFQHIRLKRDGRSSETTGLVQSTQLLRKKKKTKRAYPFLILIDAASHSVALWVRTM
jgi:hypothetical protein